MAPDIPELGEMVSVVRNVSGWATLLSQPAATGVATAKRNGVRLTIEYCIGISLDDRMILQV
jgi:hypothetical protein